MALQKIISGRGSICQLSNILKKIGCHKVMLVCGNSVGYLSIKDSFIECGIPYVPFSDYTPNPLYEDVCQGVLLFNAQQCDAIVAIGGGSAIDVAKCIKLFCQMKPGVNYLEQKYRDTHIPLIAVPTTAGTGSESTRYAVVYYKGQKHSVTHESIIPSYAILDHDVLMSLPLYQKKCTLLDALCQGIESWWSVNSTIESREYSRKAVNLIVSHLDGYINKNDIDAAEQIMLAANYAGRAINITQTTAAHAMSYKLTSLYHIPHGHAVALCLPYIWEYMLQNMASCRDPRGSSYLSEVFFDINSVFEVVVGNEAIEWFKQLLSQLKIYGPSTMNAQDLKLLCDSVNPERMHNNPIELDNHTIVVLYSKIIRVL